MAHPSKRKGTGFEREVVQLLRDKGIAAERIPLSGAAGGSFCGDIDATVRGIERRVECKRRAREFSRLHGYIADHYAAIVRDDRTPPLVVMRFDDWVELIK